MIHIVTESGTNYVIDTDNSKIIRKSEIPLWSLFWEDNLSNEWQEYTEYGFVYRPGYEQDCLSVKYPNGMWSLSTGIVSLDVIEA